MCVHIQHVDPMDWHLQINTKLLMVSKQEEEEEASAQEYTEAYTLVHPIGYTQDGVKMATGDSNTSSRQPSAEAATVAAAAATTTTTMTTRTRSNVGRIKSRAFHV